jgi:multiple sugar transport system ATP-binding protein
MNILSGSITDGVFHCPDAKIPVGPTAPAGDVQIGFRPETAAIVAASEPGAMPARVYTVEPLGNEVIVSFLIGDTIVHVRAPADSSVAMGDSCGLRFDLRYVHLFNPADGQRIDWVA